MKQSKFETIFSFPTDGADHGIHPATTSVYTGAAWGGSAGGAACGMNEAYTSR